MVFFYYVQLVIENLELKLDMVWKEHLQMERQEEYKMSI